MDCGPSCLRMIAMYYGKYYSIQSLRNRSYITKSGVSMFGSSEASESKKFCTRGYLLTYEQLRDEVPLPCIVNWNQRHFVVVYRIKKQRAWGREKGETSHEGRASHESQASQANRESPRSDLQDKKIRLYCLRCRSSHRSYKMH